MKTASSPEEVACLSSEANTNLPIDYAQGQKGLQAGGQHEPPTPAPCEELTWFPAPLLPL